MLEVYSVQAVKTFNSPTGHAGLLGWAELHAPGLIVPLLTGSHSPEKGALVNARAWSGLCKGSTFRAADRQGYLDLGFDEPSLGG